MSNSQEEDPLEALLALAESDFDKPQQSDKNESENPRELLKTDEKQCKTLTEFDLFGFQEDDKPSLIHNGDTDSSEDEDNRNFEDQKYNDCGKQIKHLLTAVDENRISSSHFGQPKKRLSTWKGKARQSEAGLSSHKPLLPTLKPHPFNSPRLDLSQSKPKDVLIDPFFGIRIVNPLISHSTIVERMQGREAVQLSTIQRFLMRNSYKEKDWVICGVVIGKSPVKTSQKGSQYSIWTLSDLRDDIKTIALFLFSGAHKDLWKTSVGTVIGILNPGIMDKRDNLKDQAALSVDNAQKVMIYGTSKDYGLCKSLRKNGDKCNAIVNLSVCEYCIYHIKQEYQKCSRRSELQANFVGKGLTALRNKVLGKNEVFYAGKSYTSIPAKKSARMQNKDNALMNKLNGSMHGVNVNSNPIVKANNSNKRKRGAARQLDVSPAQRLKDIEMLKKLGGGIESKINFSGIHSSTVTLEGSKSTALTVINKLKSKPSEVIEVPRSSQYDLKSDLIVNVEGKNSFSGKISENVTLEESKSTALSVISKLKAKKVPKSVNDQKENVEEQQSIEEILSQFDCDEDDLKYDDDFGGKSTKESLVNQKLKHSDGSRGKSDNSNIGNERTALKTPSDSSSSREANTPEAKCIEKYLSGDEKMSSSIPKSNSRTTPKFKNSLDTSKSLSSSKMNCKTSAASPKTTNITDNVSKSLTLNTPKSKNTSVNEGASSDNKSCLGVKTSAQTAPKSGNSIFPTLSGYSGNGMIDLNVPLPKTYRYKAKLNAINFIQKHGPIKKVDPNSTKASGKKRILSEISKTEENESLSKKSKLQDSEFISDRWKKMMAATSKHEDLIEEHYDEEKEKYFKKLEVKEKMEEKMTSTYKVACKAVKCLKCKYTSFSASDLCKAEGHPLRVFDAMKRFFKCGNCQNRTVSLEIVPTRPCKNCGSGRWEKTGMMREKIARVQHSLSIRGGEQKFVNSDAKDANLDLLVPDDGT